MQNEVNTNMYDDDEIDLFDLARAIISKWYFILLFAILLGGAGFAYAKYMIVPTYESTSQLYVLSKSTSITSLADIQTGANLTHDYMIVVSGRPVLDRVIINLGLNESYDSLVRRVKLNNPSDTRILSITVTDENPEQAKIIADNIADVASDFIAEKMDQDPPSIIQYGYVSHKQTNGSKKKYAGLGAIAGAFIVIAITVIFYFVNDTILSAEDVERKLGLKTIAQLPVDGDMKKDKAKRKKHKAKKKSEVA